MRSETACLPQGLNKRHALDVPNRSSELNDAYVWHPALPVHGRPSNTLDPVLDGVGDVRHYLDSLAQIVATALALNDMLQGEFMARVQRGKFKGVHGSAGASWAW